MRKFFNFLFAKRLFTRRQVAVMIHRTKTATTLGCFDYIQSDQVKIKQKTTGRILQDVELCGNPNKDLQKFVAARLAKEGIKISTPGK